MYEMLKMDARLYELLSLKASVNPKGRKGITLIPMLSAASIAVPTARRQPGVASKIPS